MKKVLIIVMGLAIFLCGCATTNYQIEKKGEVNVSPAVIKSKSYTVETIDDPTPPVQVK